MEPRSPEVKARTGVSPAKRVTFAGAAMGERLFLDEQLQQTGFDRAWSIGLAAAFAATAGKTRRPVRSGGPIGSPQSRSELCRRGRFWCRREERKESIISEWKAQDLKLTSATIEVLPNVTVPFHFFLVFCERKYRPRGSLSPFRRIVLGFIPGKNNSPRPALFAAGLSQSGSGGALVGERQMYFSN
ncbi:hypothetical protein PAPYR_10776 [Paratrimastix pyriformis]|uniref:Uncharacterized protein n=1 Tax=Paratrimastix pyriformis TaxID=342808 RepID=A0ABQ8U577_9EUKA|nr:hypothetical protein PAPYR_10776 [Paratrimastix pyriformis]